MTKPPDHQTLKRRESRSPLKNQVSLDPGRGGGGVWPLQPLKTKWSDLPPNHKTGCPVIGTIFFSYFMISSTDNLQNRQFQWRPVFGGRSGMSGVHPAHPDPVLSLTHFESFIIFLFVYFRSKFWCVLFPVAKWSGFQDWNQTSTITNNYNNHRRI